TGRAPRGTHRSPLRRGRRAPTRPHGRRRAGASRTGPALGPARLCRGGGARRAAAPAGRRGRRHATPDHDRRGDRAHHRRPRRVGARGDRLMTPSIWADRVRARLDTVVASGRWREPREFDAFGPQGTLGGTPVVSFASNDYLGLSAHPAVVAAGIDALRRWGAGAGASRMVTGSRPVHTELERVLAEWKETDAAICFPTGFAANLGALSVLGGPEVRVLSDELNHASIIDGCRLSRSQLSIYRHCDMAHLAALLEMDPATPTIVATDTVFSMDGDAAPVREIAVLCRRHGA